MSDSIVVGISDYKISRDPDIIVTYALGSCVGTAIYDATSRIGGLSHIMLPVSNLNGYGDRESRMKFADTALNDMVKELIAKGAKKNCMNAKIVGGANMFETQFPSPFGNIGDRNVESVKQALCTLGIPIVGEDTGANYGRTVYFDLKTGKLNVKSIGHGTKML